MHRYWQWLWDGQGPQYSWLVWLSSIASLLMGYLACALFVLHMESSNNYVAAGAVTTLGVGTAFAVVILPGSSRWSAIERWAGGEPADEKALLESSYVLARGMTLRVLVAMSSFGGVTIAFVGVIAGADLGRAAQYAAIGVGMGLFSTMIAAHTFVGSFMRPIRLDLLAEIAGDGAGEDLPRSRPSFVAWGMTAVLGTILVFTTAGSLAATASEPIRSQPVFSILLAIGVVLVAGIPLTLMASFGLWLAPLRGLREGTARAADGDYSYRLPVVDDDDMGLLSASFNRMQRGLAERERLHGAFGTYVDPALTTRLLEQGGDVFNGERREVTIMFIDIRDFTPFAEAHSAEETVAHLNEVFEIVVPAIVRSGGHVNKFLGDGAMAVFGAPNDLPDHADAAVATALEVQGEITERFNGSVRIGIGINTGQVIAGTIGGGGKLEFTLIGDTVNVAARIEQLTKDTGDGILCTQATLDALSTMPPGVTDRGPHPIKGKSAAVTLHAIADAAV